MAHTRITRTAVLTFEHISEVVRAVGLDRFMDDIISGLSCAGANLDPEATVVLERSGFQYTKPDVGLIEWMPSMELGRAVGIKTVGYHPTNPTQRLLPSVMSTTSIHDTSTGQLTALVDSTLLTALRTGAASAVVTHILASPEASVVGIVGAGAQAVTQIHAISRVRQITRVIAFDTDPAVSATLASRLPLSVPVTVVETAAEAIALADIVCSATTVDIGAGPVLPDCGYLPHVHINAVGSDFPGKVEVPVALLRAAFVVPDDPPQCIREGESQQLELSELGPSLPELISNAGQYEHFQQEISVFDSTGWSLEDLIVAELALDHARQLGIGMFIDLQSTPTDPYSPYEDVLG